MKCLSLTGYYRQVINKDSATFLEVTSLHMHEGMRQACLLFLSN